VREEGRRGRLVAEWRIADARWLGPMEAGGLTATHQVHLELDLAGPESQVETPGAAGFSHSTWIETRWRLKDVVAYKKKGLVGSQPPCHEQA
jgi:hypothetical protein